MTFEDIRGHLLDACSEGEQRAHRSTELRRQRGYRVVPDNPAGVYILLDVQGVILYVGCSRSPLRRLREHMRGAFASQIATWTMEWTSGREAGLFAERRLIQRLDPKHNIDWKGGVFTRPAPARRADQPVEAA